MWRVTVAAFVTPAIWRTANGLIGHFVPPARRGGRKREVSIRKVLNGMFYALSTGCQWSALPKDLPPKSTEQDYSIHLLDRAGAQA